MQKTVKMPCKGKASGNGQMDRIFMLLTKKLTPGVILVLPWDYIRVHVYDHYSQTNLLVFISQISGER